MEIKKSKTNSRMRNESINFDKVGRINQNWQEEKIDGEIAADYAPVILSLRDMYDSPHIYNFLNLEDRDLLIMCHSLGLTQCEIMEATKLSQPLICYQLKRLKKRLEFAMYLNDNFDLYILWLQERSKYYDSKHVAVLTAMYYTTSFTDSKNVINLSQNEMLHLFDLILDNLKANKESIYSLFAKINENLRIIKRYSSVKNSKKSKSKK